MNLYLSSVGLPDPVAFRGLFAVERPTIGLVVNAWDVYPSEKAAPFLESITDILKNKVGCKLVSLDLRQPVTLDGLDGVWVTGGNVFYLNWLMFQSGFDQAISSVHRAFVYGGESAGAVVTGPTLHGAQYMDNPDDAPEVVWNGLSIVNFGIVPHWGEAKYSKKLESIRDELAKYTEVIELRNAQAVVVRDGSVRVDT